MERVTGVLSTTHVFLPICAVQYSVLHVVCVWGGGEGACRRSRHHTYVAACGAAAPVSAAADRLQAKGLRVKLHAFVKFCLLPRLLRSASDAVFCHLFTLKLHELDVPNWPAGFFWDEVRFWG
jgi:hypothetical protein